MSVIVTLGMLTWNLGTPGTLTISALMKEQERIDGDFWQCEVELIDNGSWDGTSQFIIKTAQTYRRKCRAEVQAAPESSTTLRNKLIEFSKESDYLVFIDGDIEIVPHSILSMLRYLQDHEDVSAIAMDPLGQTKDRNDASSYCRSIKSVRRDPLMYLCGYGVFRRSLFEHLSFDEEGPLGQCGWGSEDDDLWLQMLHGGYDAVYAEGYTYWHPEPRSSWKWLRELGINPKASFEARRQYVLTKWRQSGSQRVAPALNLLAGQHVESL